MAKDELKPIDTSKYKITETGQVLKTTKDEMKDEIKNRSIEKTKKKCVCCGNEIEIFLYEDRDFCDSCFPIVCREVFNKANNRMTVKEVKEKISRLLTECRK